MFWRQDGKRHTSIFAGSMDSTAGLCLESQLFVQDAPDYDDVPNVPCVEQDTLTSTPERN